MAEWDASEYNRQSSLQAALAEEQLSRLTLEGAERVLDVGCGDGKITAEIAARVPHGSVLGVDPSQNMIAFATGHFGSATRRNLRFEVADVRHLTYREEFDRVVSFNALHWVPEQGAALQLIRTALVDGGLALLRFVPEGRRQCLEDVLEDVRQSARWASYFKGFQRPYAHFPPRSTRTWPGRTGFASSGWDSRTGPGTSRRARHSSRSAGQRSSSGRALPESDWPLFITEVLDRYRTVAPDSPQESNTFKFYQLEVVLEPAWPTARK
jgi:trans-aconitate 2-methyltransferase